MNSVLSGYGALKPVRCGCGGIYHCYNAVGEVHFAKEDEV